MDLKTFDSPKAIDAQKAYTKEKSVPHFAPSNGICYNCKKNIYTSYPTLGKNNAISVEAAGTKLITGCPHCHKSYCD